MFRIAICFALLGNLAAAEFPQAEISNGSVRTKIYLPDAVNGYYRGTRFDWSGAVSSLVYKDHNYFGKWFDRYDPKIHDAITGPVEEFLTNNSGLGYDDAKPGESFVKIGVGALRKPNDAKFEQFHTYEISDPGTWTTKRGADWIEFTQQLNDTRGYAYVYRKRLQLAKDRPQLVLEHTLKNTGKKTIDSSVYEHNFYMIDGQPSGPEMVIKFPFEVRAVRDLKGMAEAKGRELIYLRELQNGESTYTELEGYGATSRDYDIRVENLKTHAGVRQTGDRPLAKLVLWSIRSTVCPEAFIDLRIEPGAEQSWRIVYDFYTLP